MEEEIAMEIEALMAIYMDDFKELDESPRRIQITLVPNPGSEDDNHVGLTLEVAYTKNYPNELPLIKIRDTFGIDTTQLKEIEQLVTQKGEETLGMSMVFTLASACKEWLDDHNISPEEKAKIAARKLEEEREQKRSEGTPVTQETFNEWKTRFYAELERKKKLEGLNQEDKSRKLTGKQMFEGNAELVSSDVAFGEDEDEKDVNIDWTVFRQELDDLDDLDEEDEALDE